MEVGILDLVLCLQQRDLYHVTEFLLLLFCLQFTMTTQKSVDSLQFYPYELFKAILDAHFEILKFFSLNDNPKNLSDDVTADTPKRTNHILLLKETQRLTLLVIQITPAAHPLVIHRSGRASSKK